MPAQEGQHQAQVAEAVFGTVAPGLADDLVERRGQVGLVFEAQPALQGHWLGGDDVAGERAAPGADLFRPHAVDLQHQRDAGHGQVDRGGGGTEEQQAVAAGQVEQAVAQVRQHGGAAWGGATRLGQRAFDIECGQLVAPGAQAGGQVGHVGGALMAVGLRHLDDQAGDDRVQAVVDQEQVAVMAGEGLQVGRIGEVEAAGQAGQDDAKLEHVGNFVVMTERDFPALPIGQEDRALDGGMRVELHHQVGAGLVARGQLGAGQGADDAQARGGVGLDLVQRGHVHARRQALRVAQDQAAAGVDQDGCRVQCGHPPLCMQRFDLRHQGQQQDQQVVGGERLPGLRLDQGGQGGVGGGRHAASSFASWRL